MPTPLRAPRTRGCRLAAALAAALLAGAALAQTSDTADPAAQEPYGWPWLVRALDRLKPSVDTRVPETPTQVAERLETMVGRGETQAALAEIDALQRERAASDISGIDARLLFLQARALAADGRLADAAAIYARMTTDFPELPEPWNNLAAIHAAQGQLDLARDALDMALLTDPTYGAAQANLADVYLMLAERAYRDAAVRGEPQAATMATRTRQLLEGTIP